MIKELFRQCGLTENEQTVLMTLIQHGTTIASIIAKQTQIKRPTVYAVLESLMNYGLVHKFQRSHVTYYSAVSTEVLPDILQDRLENTLSERRKAIELLRTNLSIFRPSITSTITGVELTTLDSRESVYVHLEKILLQGDFMAIFNPQEVFENQRIKKIAQHFLEETGNRRVAIREIMVSGSQGEWYKRHIRNPYHQIKEISSDKNIRSEIILTPHKVILGDYNPPPEILVTIGREDFFESMKTVFDILWDVL